MSSTLESVKAVSSAGGIRAFLGARRRWAPVLATFLSVQILVQALSMVAGILLVRSLSQREYAFYTMANTMQATLILLADIGTTSALTATGGQVWQDRHRFGALIQTGQQIRRLLAAGSFLVVLPIIEWMLIRNGASPVYALGLGLIVMMGAGFRLTGDVLAVVPKIHGHLGRLQRIELLSGLLRFCGTVVACLIYVNAALGVLAASLPLGVQILLLRRWAAEGADLQASANADDRKTIWRIVRHQAPNTIYYCIQGQLIIFLLSRFGTTRTIAEVGALGRLTVLFALVGSVLTTIVQPRFARCQDRARLRQIYGLTVAGFALISLALIVMASVLPGPFLWLLGKRYAYLHRELFYMVLLTIVHAFAGMLYGLNSARAWIKWAWVSVPIIVCGQIVMIPRVDLSTVKGAALLSGLPILFGTLPFLYDSYRGFLALPKERDRLAPSPEDL
jgi:O-antigen/teichoic acid export membrane protein